jgi:hypothetical protein
VGCDDARHARGDRARSRWLHRLASTVARDPLINPSIRDPEDPLYAGLRETVERRHALLIDILYTNDEGDQRAITRFVVVPPEDEGTQWFCSVGRHTYLDRPNPR